MIPKVFILLFLAMPLQSFAEGAAVANFIAHKSRISTRPECSDGKDNDRDGRTDFPADKSCQSRSGASEKGSSQSPRPPSGISLGVNVSLKGAKIFPANDPWNQDISSMPVDPNSRNLINSIGADVRVHPDWGTYWEGRQIGFNYMVVAGNQKRLPINCYYPQETDPGLYPIPLNFPIQQGADRHVIVIDRDNWKLYELFDASAQKSSWKCGSGAIFDLRSNTKRPAGWTSADAAGLPIFPGLVRWDEVVEQKEIKHALRFTVPRSRRAYVAPASHFASSETDPNLPPMGMRVRLKASYNINPYPAKIQVVLRALKKYGMFVADNGRPWDIPGIFDTRWNDQELGSIKEVFGSDFEVVKMGAIITK